MINRGLMEVLYWDEVDRSHPYPAARAASDDWRSVVQKLSVADIADQFDVSEQYVKALLHYGLRSLKSAVDGDSERAYHRYAMSGGSESHAVPGQASTIAGPALGGVSR